MARTGAAAVDQDRAFNVVDTAASRRHVVDRDLRGIERRGAAANACQSRRDVIQRDLVSERERIDQRRARIDHGVRIAREAYIPGGVNRVILATDGDFNVGVTSQSELLDLIERERESGVFLSVFGVGSGNLKDATMEMLWRTGERQLRVRTRCRKRGAC